MPMTHRKSPPRTSTTGLSPPRLRPTKSRRRVPFSLLLFIPVPLLFLFFHPPHLLHSPLFRPSIPLLPVHIFSLSPSPPSLPANSTAHPLSTRSLLSTPGSLLSAISDLPSSHFILLLPPCSTLLPNSLESLFLPSYFHNTISHPKHTADHLDSLLPLLIPLSLLLPLPSAPAPLFLNLSHFRAVDATIQYRVCTVASPNISTVFNIPENQVSHSSLIRLSSNSLPSDMYPSIDAALPDIASLRSLSERHFAKTGVSSTTVTAKRVLFAMPWIQMGGSELAMLHLMEYVVRVVGWKVTVLLVQPFVGEDQHGNLELKHEWMGRLNDVTWDVVNVPAVAGFHRAGEVLRYVLETRKPRVLVFSNARWVYQMVPLIRELMPRVLIADYNHMVYLGWNGGGCPRYGANATEFMDAHFTASDNVTGHMKGWIKDRGYEAEKVQTCYIGTDLSIILTGKEKETARRQVRLKLKIPKKAVLVLFAGRFVEEKGLDVLASAVKRLLPRKPEVAFLIVGDGDSAHLLDGIPRSGRVVVHEPVYDDDLRRFYAAADVFLLPSVNEGIALVLYEAMAAGLVIVATDVGGQKELVTPERGILIKPGAVEDVTNRVVSAVEAIVDDPRRFDRKRETARRDVSRQFNILNFQKCVIDPLVSKSSGSSSEYNRGLLPAHVLETVRETLVEERQHGTWGIRQFPRRVDHVLSVAYIDAAKREGFQKGRWDGAYGQLKSQYGMIERLVVSARDDLEMISAERNVRIVQVKSDEVLASCSLAFSMHQATLACTTELILFAKVGDSFEPGIDLQAIANVMRAERRDILGITVTDSNDKNTSVEQITWHDQGKDKVKTCIVPESETHVFSKGRDPADVRPIGASISPGIFMARTESMNMFFERFGHGDMSITEMYLGFWKMGLSVGYLPGHFVHRDGIMGIDQSCKKEGVASSLKESLFEILHDKDICPEGSGPVRYWGKL